MKIVADENIPFVKECFSSIGEVAMLSGRKITPETIADADCLLVRSITPVNEKLLAKSKVKFVATATIGFEHVALDYLNKRGIGFASAPGSNANSVADYLVAALLSVGEKHKMTLEGKFIGVVGVGNVGSRVEKKCRAMGMNVLLNDPPLARQTGDSKYRPLHELLDCDFITLHTPLTREGEDKTFHLANEKFFNSLKTGCVFINTSRGAVHDTAALKAAINSKKLSAVILDVWENEPDIDCELLRLVDISTPHIAGYSLDGKIAGLIMIYNAACRHFGLKPTHKIEDFLPPSTVPQIVIDKTGDDKQALLHEIVQQVYAINRDDFNTREIALAPPARRGKFFDDLRKNYPVRREFQNTTVILKQYSQILYSLLTGIGFKTK
ncbi:MAG: 4-phosphoerythronate dehydrogenase PdxB [Sedimentisphaerales bacterium]|nr:4-phosphoerythronate dehydrogenase PdxB [Sedimentisphaerales bacterium]